MRFHCGSETPALAGCRCPATGTGTGPNAAPSLWLLPAHPSSSGAGPCPRHPFGELSGKSSPRSGIPSPQQPILGPVSGTLRLGSINILPSLSGQLSSHLMLGWRQASLWEDEDEDDRGCQPR